VTALSQIVCSLRFFYHVGSAMPLSWNALSIVLRADDHASDLQP
jgi:hypothetical protein